MGSRVTRAKVWLASLFRKWAYRLDYAGAPKCTPWSFTIEDGVGIVFNTDRKGCPVWFYGDLSYQRAYDEARWGKVHLEKPEWLTIGYRTAGGMDGEEVLVLGSADLAVSSLTRKMEGYDEFAPFSVRVPDFARPRMAKVPRWSITLNCKMQTFVQVTGKDYQDGVTKMFGRAGRSG